MDNLKQLVDSTNWLSQMKLKQILIYLMDIFHEEISNEGREGN